MSTRRDFITLLGGAAAARPVAAWAQQPERMRRIGVLIGVAGDAETKAWVATFRKRLDELGWKSEGNLQIEERWTAGDPERNRTFAGELLAMKPDAIFAFSSVAVAALQRESHAVPIVFTAISEAPARRPSVQSANGPVCVAVLPASVRGRGCVIRCAGGRNCCSPNGGY